MRFGTILRGLVVLTCTVVFLCSCTAAPPYDVNKKRWHQPPPEIEGITPPSAGATVPLALESSFPKGCTSYDTSFKGEAKDIIVDNISIQILSALKQDILNAKRISINDCQEVLVDIKSEWQNAIRSLGTNTEQQWGMVSRTIEDNTITKVLSPPQLAYYTRLRNKGWERDKIYPWLALTREQIWRIKSTYTAALQKCQVAWVLSQAFQPSTHGQLDRLLIATGTIVSQADEYHAMYTRVNDILAGKNDQCAQIGRELSWLDAKLTTASDLREKIRIRKEMTDLQYKIDELNRQSQWLDNLNQSFVWEIGKISGIRDHFYPIYKRLNDHHSIHTTCINIVSTLNGQPSNNVQQRYRELNTLLSQGLYLPN